jgi:NTE family protein
MMLEQLGNPGLSGPLANLRRIDSVVVLPGRDVREVAAEHAGELPWALRQLLRGIGASSRDGRQLISYLLFESGYTRALIDLGYRDGMNRRDDLEAFLFDRELDHLEAPYYLRADLER